MKSSRLVAACLGAVFVSCGGGAPDQPSPGSTTDETPKIADTADDLTPLARFEGVYDATSGVLTIHQLFADAKGDTVRVKAADTLGGIPASSSGVPAGGGVVAFSPTPGVSCGANCVTGPINLVNRYTPSSTLRNVYAVVTSISGATLANADSTRGFPGIPSHSGVMYYEHLSPSDLPSAGQDPTTTVGFRGQRTWTFNVTSGTGEFTFKFDVYARAVACTQTNGGVESASSAPDVDADCDGVAGLSRQTTLFVDPTYGDDSTGDGSIRAPYASASKAATMVSASKTTVAVAARTFTDPGNFIDASRVNLTQILGGYDGDNGFGGPRTTTAAGTVISFTQLPTSQDQFAIKRIGITSALYVQRLTFKSPAGRPGTTSTAAGSSYAMYLADAGVTAGAVTLDTVTLDASAGGGPGAAGNTGAAGTPGNAATGRGGANAPAACSVSGAAGTAGGQAGTGNGDGNPGVDNGPVPGGSGGNGDANCASATNGGAGGSGTLGAGGGGGSAGTASLGGVSSDLWGPLASGVGGSSTAGGAGRGGAGGGGGGGCSAGSGGRGGGGGSGGCGGGLATGGSMGGAGIAIWTAGVPLTAGSDVSTLATGGAGGAGGAGGSGGAGGAGDPGVTRPSPRHSGGAGGTGGNGGGGGGGGGGAGGPAMCAVIRNGTTASGSITCTRIGGPGGAAGAGGAPTGNSGSVGPTGTTAGIANY